eukprot:15451813-Alexandrium_andersonii.AAC.1
MDGSGVGQSSVAYKQCVHRMRPIFQQLMHTSSGFATAPTPLHAVSTRFGRFWTLAGAFGRFPAFGRCPRQPGWAQ